MRSRDEPPRRPQEASGPSSSAWTASTHTSRWMPPRVRGPVRAPPRGASRSRASSPSSPSRPRTRGWSRWTWTTRRSRRCASCTPPRSPSWTSGSAGLMNKLDDEKLLDETVVYYISDHGLTLGEDGMVGKAAARAQWHIYHVPCMIRHPEGKRAGERSDYFASTHDVAPTLLSFMGIRAPGQMDGRGPVRALRRRAPPGRARSSPPATRTTSSRATTTGSSSRTARAGASACTTSGATRRSRWTWPRSTPRSWTASGAP